MQRPLSNVSVSSYQEYQPSRKYGPQYEPGGYATAVQQRTNMTQREDALKFEQGRIRALQEERLHIQKKTFTKWINSFLQKARMEVDDLFQDLDDGRRLLKLLEIISGERLPRPNSGRMRVHKIENVNKSLSFLHTKVRLESIGAEDIVDGNPRLILGLVWTIILRFQIQEIEIDVDEENVSSEKKSAKDALLLWCQRKTSGYHGVHIHNFTDSWRSGLGFNALIHAHRPDLFRWADVPPEPVETLNHAFDVAHANLGIPRLLDAEDVDTSRPDEKSVMTYVASYYHTFARMKNEQKSGRRIANIIGQLMELDSRKEDYSQLASALLDWIRAKTEELRARDLPNSLDGIQRLLLAFKQYRTVEKPPKYKERSEIEALYFALNTMQKSVVGEPWTPPDGQLPMDIERAWQQLEQAEHLRELALRTELLRQQRLEQLNYKFNTKSVLRKGYLKEMIQVLSDPRYGSNLQQVDATVKKHEAISADILARTERFEDLSAMAAELVRERYHGAEAVSRTEAAVLQRWRELLELLEGHRVSLSQLSHLMSLLREADALSHTLGDIKTQFQSEEVGRHLVDVERLAQAHALQEAALGALHDSLRKLQRQARALPSQQGGPAQVSQPRQQLDSQLQHLEDTYDSLVAAAKDRRARLEDARNLYQFLEDHDEEEAWVTDKQRICVASVSAKDARGAAALKQKHAALLTEMAARDLVAKRHRDKGQSLIEAKHPKSSEISRRVQSLAAAWDALRELAAAREKQLADALEAHQFYGDANESESWMKERRALVSAPDVGRDAPAAAALLGRHKLLREELAAYKPELDALVTTAERLQQAGITQLELPLEADGGDASSEEEWVSESRLVPADVWEEQPVERLEHRTVTEERSVPQVKALYAFTGQGISMAKGEVMFLMSKTNPDWWSVRKADRTDGFVPANYVREIEPRVVPVQVRRPEKVVSVQRVKKTVLVKQVVPVRKARPVRKPRAAPAPVRNAGVGERIRDIQGDYAELQKLSEARQAQLEDAIRLYNLYAECDDLAKWMKEKDRMLRSDGPPGAVGEAKREYEKFVTDLSAANKRLDGIEAAAQALAEAKHPQAGKVSARHQQLREQWDRLIRLKQQKEKSLEGATSVELFSRTCQEAIEWMESKEQQLGAAPGATADLRTARALQRRHARLEREMQPLRDRVHTVGALAEDVKSQYPSEKAAVEEREKELHAVWARCEEGAASRRARLESAVGLQVFGSSARQLAEWMQKVLEQLSTEEAARDAATAEAQLKQHQDLRDDIKAHQDEFVEVVGLGKQLLASHPNHKEVAATVQQLEEHHAAILKGWDVKQARLQQTASLRALQREADHLDAASRAHQAYLDYDHHPTSVDEALALVKRHEELEARVAAQQERLATYGTRAQDTAQGHYAKDEILSRRASVIQGRERVKAAVAGRRSDLQAELQYQQFVWSCEEVMDWIRSKNLVAKDQSYRDLANLERRLQRHQAFERELQANERQHRDVGALGESIVAADPSRAEAVEQRLEGLVEAWAALLAATRDKGAKLRQAADQRQHKRSVEEARLRLAELERSLRSEDTGSDLRTCKRQLAQHQTLEQELTSWETKTSALEATGEDLVSGGHFDAAAIEKESRELAKAGKELQPLAKKRRQALESSLQLHKFAAEVSGELAWVSERKARTLAMATPADLTAAQSALKKHAKLRGELQGRQPVVERVLAQGERLVEEEHPDGEKITSLCKELEEAYSEVCSASEKRGVQLEAALKAQQFLHDAVELDSWLADKAAALAAADLGADRHRATQLLTRHKAVELELDTYAAIIAEMGRAARGMADGPAVEGVDGPALLARHQELANSLQRLQRLAAQRQKALVESVCRHEYLSESEELSQWVQEQLTAASSDDYGADYEHLLILRSKFEELRLRVEAGAERFAQCEELAHKLAANDTPHLADIERRQEALGESWQRLVEQIQSRGSRLHAAGEIHRFHRDVGELLARAADKRAALAAPPPPRDLAAASALLRNQDTIETDMVAIDAQIQVLQEEGTRLQKLYPGGNVAAIASQQQALADAWDALRDAAEARRHTLTQHLQLHRFLTQVRDLTSWSSSLRAEMSRAVRVRDAVSAQAARAEHAAARAELDARDQSFRDALALGERLVEEGHPNSEEITDRMGSLRMERLALGHAWGQRQVALDQLIDLHCFLRDAAQIHDLCAAQEAALSTEISPNSSVEEVDHQLKKHEAFEKLLATQDEKLSTLNSHGDKLLQQSHVESARIAEELKALNERRKKLHSLSMQRGQQLRRLAARAQFARAAADARGWVHDKLHVLDKQQSQAEVVNLEDKIKKLQKHQAFTAELAAHRARLAELRELAEELIPDKDVEDQIKKLAEDWQKLEQATEERGRGLEEAQDILEFNQQIDKIEAWIRDKEMMVQAHELGRDYEHCEQLQRKLDDLDSDMMVDDQRVKALAALADKLQQQGPSAQSRSVAVRRDALLGKWRSLQGALLAYRQALAAAKEIHAFNRDVSDTLERISVKSGAFAATSKGRSAEAARALQRKHAAQRAEAGAVKDRMDRLEGEGKQLANKYPERKPEIEEGLATLRERWAELQQLAERRAKQLDEAVNDHQFEETLKELEVWVGESVQRMAAAAPGRDDADADKLLDSHHEIKTEIDGRQKAIATLAAEAGEAPVRRERVQALSSALDTAWQTRKHYLTQAQQLQQLKEQARLAEDWLAAKEAVLNNDDLGEDLDAVEALLRKHAEFSKLVESQAGRITDLATFGNKLVEEQHYDSDYIRKRVTDVLARRDKLQELVVSRGSQLSQSRQLLQFLRDLAHEREWIAHRMRLASDDDYRELSNLQSKIQKHTSFEAELDASKGRLTALAAHGEALIAQNHYASREIAMHVEELENQWRDLQSLSKQRRTRLSAALAARVFLRGLDELALWLDDAEAALLSEQLGKDISSVTALLKRHSRLEQQTQAKADAVATLADTARQLADSGHFMADEIMERTYQVVKRYRGLSEPLAIRRDNLEDAMLLQRWLRDADEELRWLQERLALATSTEVAATLPEALAALNKHRALQAEILARDPMLKAVLARASTESSRGHFAAATFDARQAELANAARALRAAADARNAQLQERCEVLQLMTEISEAEAWVRTRRAILTATDVGRDEDSVLALQRRLALLQAEMAAYDQPQKLARVAAGLVEKSQEPDAEAAKRAADAVLASFEDMKLLSAKRDQRLQQSLKYFKFVQEWSEAMAWTREQLATAASEEYGTDAEHVDALQQAFAGFLQQLQANSGRIESVCEAGLALEEAGAPDAAAARAQLEDLRALWDDLRELAQARQEALAGARQVHEFDRSAEETAAWLSDKQRALDAAPRDHRDLHSAKRRLDALGADLSAITAQHEKLKEEAERLSGLFPDAREHVSAKLEEVSEALQRLAGERADRAEHLDTAAQLRDYFANYQDLLAWTSEMLARVTAGELARDVAGAERLLARHRDLEAEISAKEEDFTKLYEHGDKLISERHLMSSEISERMSVLRSRRSALGAACSARGQLYQQHLDALCFQRDADALDTWIRNRVPLVRDGELGESVSQVEELINRHRDLEETIDGQKEKFNALKRVTLVEQAFKQQQEEEANARRRSAEQQDAARLQRFRQLEMDRIVEERRKDSPMQPVLEREISVTSSAGTAPTESPEETLSPAPQFDRLPRGSVPNIALDSHVKRAESMNVTKSSKRTPSFTTRRRTQSFRRHRRADPAQLPPVEIEGDLERKQECGSGGARATVRSWRAYYSVLCGQLLCFFKDEQDFHQNKAAAPPIAILNATCTEPHDYTKRQHTFRLSCSDGARYLFAASSRAQAADWRTKLAFHAALPPSLQLTPYGEGGTPTEELKRRLKENASSSSSPASSPEPTRRPRTQAEILHEHRASQGQRQSQLENQRQSVESQKQPESQNQRQSGEIQEQKQMEGDRKSQGSAGSHSSGRVAPATPDRNIESSVLPSLPARAPLTPTDPNANVVLRNDPNANPPRPTSPWGRSRFSNGRDVSTEFIASQRDGSLPPYHQAYVTTTQVAEGAPPLPLSGPPPLPDRDPPGSRQQSVSSLVNSYQQRTRDHRDHRDHRDSRDSRDRQNNWQGVETSHYYSETAYGGGPRPASVAGAGSPGLDIRPASRSSGESEVSVSGTGKEKKDKKGVFGGLFSRKKRPTSHM